MHFFQASTYPVKKRHGDLDEFFKREKDEMKAYLGVCVIMGINNLPKLADDWSSDIFLRNDGIKQTMSKNRFEEISQFFHLNNSSEEAARSEENFARLYKCRPTLTSILRNAHRCYSPKKKFPSMRE